jgi:UDP-N-acetylmuramoyl-tripeptide--D-alanyl-D-alanine ligase
MRRERLLLSEAASYCGGIVKGAEIPLPVNIWPDSRDVCPKDGFVALPGEHTDGHRFVGAALDNGAGLIIATAEGIAQWERRILEAGASCLLVEDTERALLRIAEGYLQEVSPKVRIAVTGSVGKTTTRELIRSALEPAFQVHSAKRSHNTKIGCALTVLSMDPGTEVLVLEMGTNHPGEIGSIVEHFPPTIAVITAVAPVHLEGLKDLDGVLSAKLEILPEEGLDLLIYNADDPKLCHALEGTQRPFRIAGVGYRKGSALLLTGTDTDAVLEGEPLRVGVSYGGQSWVCHSLLKGKHHAYNIGFAFMVGLALGVPPETLLKGISRLSPLRGRGKWIRDGRVHLLIDESYNANPSSVAAALEVLRSLAVPGRRLAVLGGMRELGEESEKLHSEIFRMVDFLDGVVLVGEEWEKSIEPSAGEKVNLWRVKDAEAAAVLLEGVVGKEDTILVKGSRSYGLERVVERLSRP